MFIQRFIGSVARSIIDVVVPPTCLFCQTLLSTNERHLCTHCWQSIPALTPSHSLFRDTRAKLLEEGAVSDLVSCFVFEKSGAVQALAHALKYDGFTTVGVVLGEKLGQVMNERGVKGDLLIPVPLYSIKRRERGFNQAERIAAGISRVTGIPLMTGALRRTRHTQTQTKLGLEERKRNVEGAFEVEERLRPRISGAICVLVDDVITTGATISSSGMALLGAGAASVLAVSAALAR